MNWWVSCAFQTSGTYAIVVEASWATIVAIEAARILEKNKMGNVKVAPQWTTAF